MTGSLQEWLNTPAAQDALGFLVMFLALYMMYRISQRLMQFACWLLGLAFFIQFLHCMAVAGMGAGTAFADYFRMDLFAAISDAVGGPVGGFLSRCGGTVQKICDNLWVWMQAYMIPAAEHVELPDIFGWGGHSR